MPRRSIAKVFPTVFHKWVGGEENDSARAVVEDISESKLLDVWKGVKTATPSAEYAIFNRMVQDGTIKGLTDDEVARIRSKYGANESTDDRNRFNLRSFGASIAAQSVIIAIATATLTSAAEGKWIGIAIVYPLLLARAIFAIYSEHDARTTTALLKQKLSLSTPTLRNGAIDRVDASDLVPGDIIQLSERLPVFADGTIIASDESFTVNETLVPGGSREIIRKGREDMIYASSVVKTGQAFMIVTETGNKRRDACPLGGQPSPIHHNEILDEAFKIGMALAAFVIFLTWLSVFYHSNYSISHLVMELVRSSFSILLVGVPIGLTAAVIYTLMGTALFLGAHGCLIRRLSVIEDFAGVDTLCCDCTGTFTRNKIQALKPSPAISSITPEDVLIFAGLATSPDPTEHDVIDRAVLEAIRNKDPDSEAKLFQYRKEKFFPFDTNSKQSSSIVRTPQGETWIYCKGAPLFVLQTVMDNSQNPSFDLAIPRYRATVAQITKSGYLCIGVARHKCTADGAILAGYSEILGIIPFIDLARPDSRQRIVDIRQNGLDVKMFSRNAQPVVERASSDFGLGTAVHQMDIVDLLTSNATPEDLERKQRIFYDKIKRADAFSEVFPQHKYNVVKSLEDNGRRVAVTADSANDRLVLRRATVGIAVCGAADGARAAADLVFYNKSDGLGSIAEAIQTSRMAFNTLFMQISYRIAVVCHTLICFAGWALFSIGQDSSRRVGMLDISLVVLIVLFSDCFAFAAGFDKTISSFTPLSWTRSTTFKPPIMAAAILAFCTCITIATIPAHGQEGAVSVPERNMEAILFLQIVLSQSWLSLFTRPGPIWAIKPTKEFLACAIGVNILATIICYAWGSLGRDALGSNTMLGWDIVYVWKMSFGLFCVVSGIYNFQGHTRPLQIVLPRLNTVSFLR